MSKLFKFWVISHENLKKDTYDIVVAIKYFEHFQRPIKHLVNIIQKTNPRIIVVHNNFEDIELGHFDLYYINDNEMVSKEYINCYFNKSLINMGYQQIYPLYWAKKRNVNIKRLKNG